MLEAHQQEEEGVDAPWVKLSDVAKLSHKITGPHINMNPQGHIFLQLLWRLSASTLNPHPDDIKLHPTGHRIPD